MSGYYLHSRRIFELYIKKPQVLLICEMILYSVRYNFCVQDGIQVKPGQCLLKYEEIADRCSVSVSQVRTALRHFVADGGMKIDNKGKKGILITLLPPFSCESESQKARENTASRPRYTGNTYKRTEMRPDPNASYDLARAEARACTKVPEFKKRVR